MAFDEELARRLRGVLQAFPDIEEKKMFGGLGFLLHGNLAIAISGDHLIVRFDRNQHDTFMNHPDVTAFAPTGRVMRGWASIHQDACQSTDALAEWALPSCIYTTSLPPKS